MVPPDSQLVAAPVASPSRRWIQSPAFDLAFIVLSPLVVLPIILIELGGIPWIAILGFALAFAHYFSTFTFYFWDDNREHHRARWLAFFAGPLILTAVYLGLVRLAYFWLISVLVITWNTYHVARQSCGLLSIYRHRAGVSDPRQKVVANAAILSANVWFALWNIESHQDVYPLLTAVYPGFPLALWVVAGLVAVVFACRLAVALWRRAHAGAAPHLPELAFIGTSIGLFHPYLWLPDSGGATYAMLLAHYVQYLGLVWLLHRRRFPKPVGSRPQVLLQRLSSNTPLLVNVLLGATLSVWGVKWVANYSGHGQMFEVFYLLVAFLHFYLDALFWAFRDPHVRRSLAPYLMRGAAAPA
jgi:hypothetical protein